MLKMQHQHPQLVLTGTHLPLEGTVASGKQDNLPWESVGVSERGAAISGHPGNQGIWSAVVDSSVQVVAEIRKHDCMGEVSWQFSGEGTSNQHLVGQAVIGNHLLLNCAVIACRQACTCTQHTSTTYKMVDCVPMYSGGRLIRLQTTISRLDVLLC